MLRLTANLINRFFYLFYLKYNTPFLGCQFLFLRYTQLLIIIFYFRFEYPAQIIMTAIHRHRSAGACDKFVRCPALDHVPTMLTSYFITQYFFHMFLLIFNFIPGQTSLSWNEILQGFGGVAPNKTIKKKN